MVTMKPARKASDTLITVHPSEVRQLSQDLKVQPSTTLLTKYLKDAQQLTRLTVSGFASDVSDNVSKLSDEVLEKTKVSEISEFSDGLSKIILLTKEVDFNKVNLDKAEGLFGKLKSLFAESKEKIVSRMTNVGDRIDEIAKVLATHVTSMQKRNIMLEELFESNMKEYQNLDAAEQAITRVKQEQEAVLERMKTQVNNKDSGISMLEQSDQTDFVLKLGVKLEYIQKMKHIALLSVPEIRRSQNNNINLVDKFVAIQTVTLPAWRKQLKLIIESLEQKKEAALGNEIDNQTNEFFKRSADLSGQNYVEVTKLSQRSVLDTSTLQHMQQALISSTTEAQQVIETAKADREATTKAISDMRQQLKETFNPAGGRSPMKRVGSN